MSEEKKNILVVRDQTFSRAACDEVIPVIIGKDVELCCIQYGPRLESFQVIGDEDSEKRVRFASNEVTEVARIRVGLGGAVEAALVFLDDILSKPQPGREEITLQAFNALKIIMNKYKPQE